MTADLDYQRLGCTFADCGGKHRSRGLCEKHYQSHRKLGFLAVKEVNCKHCNSIFSPRQFGALFCTPACKGASWRVKHPVVAIPYLKKHSQYWAGYCVDCKCSIGSKREVKRCGLCQRVVDLPKNAEISMLYANKKHKKLGRVISCVECAIEFCPLYGSSNTTTCNCCKVIRQRRHAAPAKLARAMRIKCKTVEIVKPFTVFERDKWTCQLCRCKTPRSLRGTINLRAPELDHIIPVSRGGDHSYKNTQCACRGCNGLKGNKPLGQLLLIG